MALRLRLMRFLLASSRRSLVSTALVLTIGNALALGCSGSEGEDESSDGEGGEKPSSGGRKASGGSNSESGGRASGGSKSGSGGTASGGRASGGRSGTGGAAGSGDGGTSAGGSGDGGSPSESAHEKVCRQWAEHLLEEADGTDCEVDTEALAGGCVADAPAAACAEARLSVLECERGLSYSCEEVFPGEPPQLFTLSKDCNALYAAYSDCSRLAETSEVCAAYAERGKNLTTNLGCTDNDDEDESVEFSIRACERKMSVEACVPAAEVLFECLTKAAEGDFRCGDLGVAVAKQNVCGTQRDALNTCLLSNTEPACGAYGQWLVEVSEALDCDADVSAAVMSCEETTGDASCSAESSAYYFCLASHENDWACSDELGPYISKSKCDAQQLELAGCQSCKDTPATVSAQITVTAADQYRLWVNGSLISETGPSWQTAETYTITLHARPYQANVIAIEAKKVDPSEDGLDRGVIAAITLGNDVLVTDASWVGYEGSVLPASWVQADYDMGSFIPAVSYGDHGTLAPWGEVDASLNGAEWIWSSGADGAAGQKSDDQTLYLRRTFYVASGEVFLDVPSTCE